MGLYSVFDVFEAKGVIHETGSSVDAHRLTLCCKGGGVIQRFSFFSQRGVISELLGYFIIKNKIRYFCAGSIYKFIFPQLYSQRVLFSYR